MKTIFLVAVIFSLIATPVVANAYIGAGLGLSALGTILGVILSILLAIFGIAWYPLKRLWRKFFHKSKNETDKEKCQNK